MGQEEESLNQTSGVVKFPRSQSFRSRFYILGKIFQISRSSLLIFHKEHQF